MEGTEGMLLDHLKCWYLTLVAKSYRPHSLKSIMKAVRAKTFNQIKHTHTHHIHTQGKVMKHIKATFHAAFSISKVFPTISLV